MSITAWTRRTALPPILLLLSGVSAFAAELRVSQIIQDCVPPHQVFGSTAHVVSPDQAYVYLLCNSDFPLSSDLLLSAFARDPESGALTHVDHEYLSREAGSMVISPDGLHLYVAEDDLIEAFARDPATGGLESLDHLVLGPMVSKNESLVITPDGEHLYAASHSHVTAYSRDAATGELTLTQVVDEGDDDGASGAVDLGPDGKHLYVGGGTDGTLWVYSLDADTGAINLIQTIRDEEFGVEGPTYPYNLAVSGDGKHVYTAGPKDEVLVFARDGVTGMLEFVHAEPGVGMLTDLGSLVVTPDGARVYLSGWGTGHDDDGINIFARDRETRRLTYLETKLLSEGGLAGPTDIALSSDGRDVYVGTYSASVVLRALPHCGTTPRLECRNAVRGKSRLQIRNGGTNDRKHRLLWSWSGESAGEESFAEWTKDGDHIFCIHDQSSGSWRSRLESSVGFGIDLLRLLAGSKSTKITLEAKGAETPLPELPFSQDSGVSAQLMSRDGQCWGALYSAPAKQNARRFRDSSD